MTEEDILLSEAVEWGNALNMHDNQEQPCTFTIRYVGKVNGPGRPIDRSIKDLATDKQPSGVILEFVAAVEQLFPEVAAAAQVHLVKQASIDDGFGAGPIAQEIERVLIELFDHRILLNRAHGDHYISFVPHFLDIALFKKLRTRYYNQFMAEARDVVTDPQMALALIKHFKEVQDYTNSMPSLTGAARYPFTDGIYGAARLSGEPMLYRGTTILAVLAKDITYEQYLGETTFSRGNTWSSHLVNDFLSRLTSTEESNMSPGTFWDSRAFHARHVSFITLWPWLWHSSTTFDKAIHFAQRYLSIVRPLVVATFSRSATSVVRANFQGKTGMPFVSGLSSLVGEVTIQYYSFESDEHSAFLATPHINPSLIKYVGVKLKDAMLRFMDLSWQITIHLADEARKLLDQDHANGITRSRKAQCVEILRRVNNLRASDRDVRDFMCNFRLAGNDLRSEWRKLHHYPEFEDFRPISAGDDQARTMDDDDVEGELKEEE